MLRHALVHLLVLLASFPLRAHAQQTCSEYVSLADGNLPAAVGSSTSLNALLAAAPDNGDGISLRFNAKQAMSALGDRLRPDRCPPNKVRLADPAAFVCTYQGPTGEVDPPILTVEMPRGRLTYLNPLRRFDPAGPDNDVTPTTARAVAQSVALGLGIPTGELDLARATTRSSNIGIRRTDHTTPPTIRRAEMVTLVPRIVANVPVLDSRLHVVVDVKGRPARVHAVWPDFRLARNIAGVRPRTDVLQDVVERLGSHGSCTTFTRLRMRVGWGTTAIADASDEAGGEAGAAGRYLPAVQVWALGPETAEDAGQYDTGIMFEVPLVTGSQLDD
jgi:hypothetical protein